MAKLVVVSNRGPRSFRIDESGELMPAGTGGGLAGTLHPLLAGSGATWVSASMSEADRLAAAEGLMDEDGLSVVTIAPDEEIYRQAYDIVSNSTLWFCYHRLFAPAYSPRFDTAWREAWRSYRTYNTLFAERVAEVADEGAVVLVQDYQLALAGSDLSRLRPDLRTVHFTHTPFADPGALRMLPAYAAAELLHGMAGFGACGFHTRRWEAEFRACYSDPRLAVGLEAPRSFVAPLGPDPASMRAEAATDAVSRAGVELERSLGGRQLMLRVDRVELSKNILRGLWAYDELLETHPQWHDQVVHLVLAYPSREGVAEYRAYRQAIEQAAAEINEHWGTPGWQPVVLDVADNRNRSVAAMARYDVLVCNPLRDGMNLVAKEGGLVNTHDGTLVLSREAGAWEELSEVALGVNPFDLSETAEAYHRALEMGDVERKDRSDALRALVEGRTASDWLADQLAIAESLPR